MMKFMEYTPGGGLRQPAFKRLRDDKAPGIRDRGTVIFGLGGLCA